MCDKVVEIIDGEEYNSVVWCDGCDDCDLGDLLTDGSCDFCRAEGEEIDGKNYCETCVKSIRWYEWLEETLDAVEALASEFEWDFDRTQYSGGFNTKSRYYELERECSSCVLGLDDDCTCETVRLRISDHGSAYCSEDISLAKEPSGDDHDLDSLKAALSRPRPCNK